jgi:hypothetical protein
VTAQSVHIAIDVTVTGEHVCGQVSDGVRQPTPFSGWLELIVALDEILGPPTASDADPTARPPGTASPPSERTAGSPCHQPVRSRHDGHP